MRSQHFYPFVFLLIVTVGCASHSGQFTRKDWADLEKWDTNKDESLDVGEFIEGYFKKEFFNRWERESREISDSVFLRKMFEFLDRSNDHVLDSAEYNSRRILWSLPGALKLKKWDINRDELVSHKEFIQGAQDANLIQTFDITTDGKITEAEMAQGMFDVSDKDNNNRVEAIEFYLWEVYRQ